MMLLLEAVAHQEGFYTKGTRPNRLNNPGDLEFHGWETLYNGTKAGDPRFSHFDTVLDGFKALQHLFTFPLYFGKTLEVAFNEYAPPGENNTNQYLLDVIKWTGFTKETVITLDLLKLPFLGE